MEPIGQTQLLITDLIDYTPPVYKPIEEFKEKSMTQTSIKDFFKQKKSIPALKRRKLRIEESCN
jgi:hypothetical protein